MSSVEESALNLALTLIKMKPLLPHSFSPKLIFFDIDGTLLDSHGNYSDKLKQELLRLHKKGVKLAIASGRPSIAAQFLFDDLPCISAGLFCTGAELYDPSIQQHLHIHELDRQILPVLLNDVRAMDIYCECYTPDYYAVESTTELTEIHSAHLRVGPQVENFDHLLAKPEPMTKLLLGVCEAKQGDALRGLEKAYPQFDFAYAHFLAYPGWLFTSVISSSADKHHGFDYLLDYHEVSASEVMAFGDSHSDTIFLQRAGVGVAMGNALPEIQSLADITTLHCDQDGVAQVLAELT